MNCFLKAKRRVLKTKTKMLRNKSLPTFFGEEIRQGKRLEIADAAQKKPALFYQHDNGQLWNGDSLEWLKTLPTESSDMVFADPPYNIKKADWDNFESQEKYIKFSLQWIEQVARILKPTGTRFHSGVWINISSLFTKRISMKGV